MSGFKKHRKKEDNAAKVRLAKKIPGKNLGRRVFGFLCSPNIPAQIKILAGHLNIPIFALVEHTLQRSAGVISKVVDNPEESVLLIKHLIENHVDARTVEKIGKNDEETANRLNEERLLYLELDRAALQIVVNFMRRGLKSDEIACAIDYGLRCRMAVAAGSPVPKDWPPDV